MNYKADSAYFAIGKQADATTAVIPSIFVPILEEDLSSDLKNERVEQIVGIDWKSNLILQGQRTHGGKVKFYADPTNAGYFLNMALALGTESGDADGYTHPFTVDDSAYYTIEIVKGNAVHRFVGCQVNKLSMSFDKGYLVFEADIVAKAKFNAGTLLTALTGAGMTSVEFNEEYDPEPCYGLVAGDVIQVWEDGVATDVTIATIVSGNKSITCASTTITATAGALITLKPLTASYATLKRPFKFGQMLVGLGANETEATANVASLALATPVDDLKLEISREMVLRHASGSNDPVILPGVPDASLTIKKLFERAEDARQYNDIAKKACTILFTGDIVRTGGDYCSLTIKLYNIKPSKLENKNTIGEYVFDETEFFVEYDNSEAIALDITLVNGVSTY